VPLRRYLERRGYFAEAWRYQSLRGSVVAHAAKRHAADQRAAAVAASLGFASVGDYVSQRRAAGLTWRAIAAESGQPQTWLRRQAAKAR